MYTVREKMSALSFNCSMVCLHPLPFVAPSAENFLCDTVSSTDSPFWNKVNDHVKPKASLNHKLQLGSALTFYKEIRYTYQSEFVSI